MVCALRCDHCKKFVEEGHSLLYKFVGFYSEARSETQARSLESYDLCDDCLDIVQSKIKEVLK